MEDKPHDLIIVGAGPAGLTAAIYAKRAFLKTLLLEKDLAGGKLNKTAEVENYPGFVKIDYVHRHDNSHKAELQVNL